jgi:exosortase A
MMFSLAMIALLIGSVVATNIPIIQGITEMWFEDGTYSHGFLLLVVTLYLFWRNKEYLQYPTEKVNTLAIGAFFAIYGVWIVSVITGIEVAYRFIMPFLLANIFFIVLQPKAAVKFVFPSLFILFAVPFWGLLSILLQHISAQVVTFLVEAYGISVFLDGTFITIQAGVFEVAGGCSGIRYLLVTFTMSSLYSYLYLKTIASKVKIVGLALLIALVTNWVRIVILVLVGHYSDMQSEMLADHNNLGWIVFCVFLIPMHFYVNKLEKNEKDIEVKKVPVVYEKIGQKLLATISMIFVAVSVIGSMHYLSNKEGYELTSENFVNSTSDVSKGWKSTDIIGGFKSEFFDAESKSIVYKNIIKEKYVQVSMHRYLNKFGATDLTDFRNKAVPKGWSVEEDYNVELTLASGIEIASVKELRGNKRKAVMLIINKVGSDFTVSNLKSKLLKVSAFVDNERYSGAIIISTPCERSCNKSGKILVDFAEDNIDKLSEFISK